MFVQISDKASFGIVYVGQLQLVLQGPYPGAHAMRPNGPLCMGPIVGHWWLLLLWHDMRHGPHGPRMLTIHFRVSSVSLVLVVDLRRVKTVSIGTPRSRP